MPGLLEFVGGSTLYNMVKDGAAYLRRRISGTAELQLERQAKWKPIVQEELRRLRSEKLRSDVIIRDVRRIKRYPDSSDDGRISAWFRVSLVGLYHRGIEVALGIHSLVWEESEGSWRLADLDEDPDTTMAAYLIGYIPWEHIDHVDLDGDEYYSYPHIFCRFKCKGQPYEKLAFCERRELNDLAYFSELETVDRVKLTSEKFGTARWAWRSS